MDIGSGQAKNYGFRQEDDMSVRIGRVTSVNSTEGRVKVAYEDSRSSSLPFPMLSMNNEYSMPKIGDRVLTVHMDNGSSKGFVFGTFYGGGSQPKANSGYRKDFDGAYLVCAGGHYQLQAAQITFNAESSISLLAKAEISIESESNPVKLVSADAELTLDAECVLKAQSVSVEADDITLKCSYGEITVEDLMKRLERVEDRLGLPHTI